MRAAPAVQATLPPDPGWRLFLRVLVAVTLAGLAAWGAAWGGATAAVMALAALAAALAGAAIGPALVPTPSGCLRWDGAAWNWQPQGSDLGQAGTVAVMIDLGGWMLLRMRSAGAPTLWLPLSERRLGPTWRALRTALHAPVPATAPSGAAE